MSHSPPHSTPGLLGRISTAFRRNVTPRRSSLMAPTSVNPDHAAALVRGEDGGGRAIQSQGQESDERGKRKGNATGRARKRQRSKQLDGPQWTGPSTLETPQSPGPRSPTDVGPPSSASHHQSSPGDLAVSSPSSSSKPGGTPIRRDTTRTLTDDTFSSEAITSSPDASISFRMAVEMEQPRLNEAKALLSICDSVRGSLTATKTLGPDEHALTQRLDAILASEVHNSEDMLDFDILMRARLDKLVADLVNPANKPPSGAMGGRHFAAVTAATSLQKRWRVRFKERYFEMDELRNVAMLNTGRLRAVSFSTAPDEGIIIWTADQGRQAEADIQFVPGHWWLNVACAHRDGMVGSSFEKLTKGRYGIAVLPLLTGVEEVINDLTSKYIRKSRNRSEMHFALLKQTGKRIRILRGYRLKSIHAPAGGVRYDGLYQVVKYSFKQDEHTEIYGIEITLERATGQRPIDLLRRIPRPSQLDDWQLYERLEAEKVRLKDGETRFTDWKLRREAERADRAHWRRSREFGNSVTASTVSSNLGVNASSVAKNAGLGLGGVMVGNGGGGMVAGGGSGLKIKDRRRSSVMLELPGAGGRIIDPKEEPTPPARV